MSTGQVAGFIVVGSFVTAKADAGDVDIFMPAEDLFDTNQVRGEAVIVFDHQAGIRSPAWQIHDPSAEIFLHSTFDSAGRVVAGCRGVNEALERRCDQLLRKGRRRLAGGVAQPR